MRKVLVLAIVGGVAVSAWFFVRFVQEATEASASASLTAFSPEAILVAVVGVLLAHGVRAANSGRLVDAIRTAPRSLLVRALAYGYLCNTLLPVRLGEVVRAFYLGTHLRAARTVMLLTVVLERAVDCILLALAAAVTTLALGDAVGASAARTAYAFAASSLTLGLALLGLTELLHRENAAVISFVGRASALFNDRIKNRMRYVVWCLVLGSHTLRKAVPWGRYVAGAALSWALYLSALVPLARAVTSSILSSYFVAAASYLSVFVPAGPGHFGTFQFALRRFLEGTGEGGQTAYAFTMLVWLVMTAPIALVALGLLGTERQGTRALVAIGEDDDPRMNKLLRTSDLSSEFDRFLDGYFSGRALSRVLSRFETTGKLRLVRSLKGGSHAMTNVFAGPGDAHFVRKSALLHEAPKLREQYRWLAKRQHLPHVPRLLREVEEGDSYSFDLEYLASHKPLFEAIHTQDEQEAAQLLDTLVDYVIEHVHGPTTKAYEPALLQAYVLDKVFEKVKTTILLQPSLEPLAQAETVVINGKTYPSLHRSVERILASPRAVHELSSLEVAPLHGDFTVDNVLVAKDGFVLIDPNDENAIGDPVVDFGKLYQSLHSGYEFLVKLDTAKMAGTVIDFDEVSSARYAALFAHVDALFQRKLAPERYRSILFHEAVHYCRLLPYRVGLCPATVPVFYAVAVRLFDQYLRLVESAGPLPERAGA